MTTLAQIKRAALALPGVKLAVVEESGSPRFFWHVSVKLSVEGHGGAFVNARVAPTKAGARDAMLAALRTVPLPWTGELAP